MPSEGPDQDEGRGSFGAFEDDGELAGGSSALGPRMPADGAPRARSGPDHGVPDHDAITGELRDDGEYAAPVVAPVPGPVCWRKGETKKKEWEAFVEWAEWYLRHFEVPSSVVPECWTQHAVLVEELTAIWTAWQVAYQPEATGRAPLEWLREAGFSRDRMAAASRETTCTHNQHADPTMYRGVAREVPADARHVHDLGLPREPKYRRRLEGFEPELDLP